MKHLFILVFFTILVGAVCAQNYKVIAWNGKISQKQGNQWTAITKRAILTNKSILCAETQAKITLRDASSNVCYQINLKNTPFLLGDLTNAKASSDKSVKNISRSFFSYIMKDEAPKTCNYRHVGEVTRSSNIFENNIYDILDTKQEGDFCIDNIKTEMSDYPLNLTIQDSITIDEKLQLTVENYSDTTLYTAFFQISKNEQDVSQISLVDSVLWELTPQSISSFYYSTKNIIENGSILLIAYPQKFDPNEVLSSFKGCGDDSSMSEINKVGVVLIKRSKDTSF